MHETPRLVLASTSPYRRALLERLQLPFAIVAREIDETPLPGEPPEHLVRRLSETKARASARDYPQSLIIGSDQVAVLGDKILGKPGNHERAVAQLRILSGKRVRFLSGLCLLDTARDHAQIDVVPVYVQFRELTDEMIENYLRSEQPYNCAGAFKSETLGIALVSAIEENDPTALVGLPLIRLVAMLDAAGIRVL